MATMIIEGERTRAASGKTYEVRNPATGEVVDEVPAGGAADVDKAAKAAAKAFGTWSKLPSNHRREILQKAAQNMLAKVEDIAQLLTREQGKTLLESRLEARRFGENIGWFADLADKIHGQHVRLPDLTTYGLVVRRPIGVCGAIVPWNFPLTLAANKVAPAIAAGNTVVLKPASTTPLATLACIEALIEGGLPEGVINVVIGTETGEAIVEHPLIRKIALTGSTPTGKKVMARAAEQLKKVTLELGGSDPCIVLDDADLEGAARAISVGRFFNCGQQCLSTKRLYVQEGAYDSLMEKLVARASKLKPGNGLDKDTRMGPMHTQTQRAEVEAQIKDAIDRGARAVYGGGRPKGGDYEKGWFIEPTILENVPDGARMWTEEVFGPALPVRKIKDLDEGLRLANDTQFGLGSSIWTGSMAAANRAVQELEAGYTWVNALVIAHDELPFGGIKQSGFGKEHGVEAFQQYTEEKSVVYGGV
ncbi:MAG TPA: aldehyde dehydrogenase family protein [Candidatus Dormibacteraeota bacterium]|nr:aldehyde dehydrogenase family protein [Candidatus Dormibacteraeota bacterium]